MAKSRFWWQDSVSWLYRFAYRWYPGDPQDIRSAAEGRCAGFAVAGTGGKRRAAADGSAGCPTACGVSGGQRWGRSADVCANACGSTHWTELLAVPCDVLLPCSLGLLEDGRLLVGSPGKRRLTQLAIHDRQVVPRGRLRREREAVFEHRAGVAVIAAPRQQHAEIVGRHEVFRDTPASRPGSRPSPWARPPARDRSSCAPWRRAACPRRAGPSTRPLRVPPPRQTVPGQT